MHRRYRQIKRAYIMMQNPNYVVLIDEGTDSCRADFVPQEELEDWKSEYGDRLKVICKDWNKEIIIF